MRVLRGEKQIKVPLWNVYYVADIPPSLYEIIKKNKTRYTSVYHRATKLLEVDDVTLEYMVKWCEDNNEKVLYYGKDLEVPDLVLFEDDPEYRYQEDAAEVLHKKQNALLQFGVGSGKTRISLLALDKRIKLNNDLRVLVVTGLAALQQNWLDDAIKFNLHADRIKITGIGNSKKSLNMIKEAGDGDILTANFDMLSNLDLLNAFADFNADIVIFDEVHMIANMGNKRVSGAMRTEGLHELGGDHWSLSASPVKFSPFDWRSLLVWLRVIDPATSQSGFESYYGNFKINYMGQRVCESYKNLDKLLPLVNSVRLCFGGVELPELRMIDVGVDGGDSRSPYNVRHYNNSVNQNKINFIRELGEQCIVACNITKPFEVWKQELSDLNVVVFDGTLSLTKRANILADCRAGKVDVLLLSTTAGGVGLNLAEAFNHMAFIDVPNSLVDFWQNYGRVYRIGAKKVVTIYKIYCKDTDDEEKWQRIYRDFESLSIFYKFV